MTQMYYRTPDGEPTNNLASLIPHVINPQALADSELADYGVARCTVLYPAVEWWQQRGARQIDTAQTPHVITWAVEQLPTETLRGRAGWSPLSRKGPTPCASQSWRASGLLPPTIARLPSALPARLPR